MVYPNCKCCGIWIERPVTNPHTDTEEELCYNCLREAGITVPLNAAEKLIFELIKRDCETEPINEGEVLFSSLENWSA